MLKPLKSLGEKIVGKADLSLPQRRLLTHLRVLDARCFACEAWDLEEGQAAMKRHKPFLGVMQALSPEQVADSGKDDVDWDFNGPKTDTKNQTRWEDYGWCAAHGECRHRRDGCEVFR